MKRILFGFALVALGIMGLVSCNREAEEFSFAAALEQPGVYNPDKNYLQDEHFIMWESGDEIAVMNGSDTVHAMGRMSGVRECVFYGNTTKSWPFNKEWYAVYPSSAWSSTSGHVVYPSTMPYRAGESNADFTFGKDCFPMVAYNNRGENDDALGFHSISGIMRIQLFSDKNEIATISSIEFTSKATTDGQTFTDGPAISGDFVVAGWDQWDPKPTHRATASSAADRKITITGINQTIGGSAAKGALRTFYLPLPATKNIADRNLTTYILEMKVNSDKGAFTKNLKVDIRRNCITMMQAIDIQTWAPNTGQTNVHLVGCGTKARPFQIYTYSELVEARDACNNNTTINGQAITENTWFKVVRADITLNQGGNSGHDNSDEHNQYNTYGPWTEGFRNFKGHFRCSSNHPTLHGIVNNSPIPLFESVSAQGEVDSVTVRGNVKINNAQNKDFSPLCLVNNGKLSNCVNQVNVDCKDHVAGVCATNNGILYGCRNEGSLTTANNKNIGGVCLLNQTNAKIRYCVVLATAQMKGGNSSQIGGVVHTNNGLVENSYLNVNQSNASGNWGGVAYVNANDIQHCHVAGSLTTQGQAGGICNRNTHNIVDCYNQMTHLQGSTYVGGLVAYMTGGEVRNCYVDGNSGTITSNNASTIVGGMVAYITGGSIENGYCVYDCHLGHSGNDGSQVGGCVGTINTTNNVKIWNVYSSYNVGFCGSLQGTDYSITNCYARSKGAATASTVDITLIKREDTYPYNTYISKSGDLDDALQGNINALTSDAGKYRSWQDGRHPVLNSNSK